MIGQTNVINKINQYTLEQFPHSTLLLGEEGSGKHTLANYIANYFGLDLIDITENVLEEDVNNYYTTSNPNFLLINLNLITEKEQNKLLKLVEEPPLNCYLILLSNCRNLVLNTLIYRCNIIELEEYSRDELQQFTSIDIDENIFKTPGQVINFNFNTLEATQELADKIINKLQSANYPNTLDIAQKFNYKDEYDKLDLKVFINILLNKLDKAYSATKNKLYKNYYLLTIDFVKKLVNTRLNVQLLFENYLTKMWKESRNGH